MGNRVHNRDFHAVEAWRTHGMRLAISDVFPTGNGNIAWIGKIFGARTRVSGRARPARRHGGEGDISLPAPRTKIFAASPTHRYLLESHSVVQTEKRKCAASLPAERKMIVQGGGLGHGSSLGKFAFQFSATFATHFSDDDLCSTACAIVFAEEVWGCFRNLPQQFGHSAS